MMPFPVRNWRRCLTLAGLLILMTAAADTCAQAAEAVTLTVRGDARQRILLLRPDGPPAATVVLYPGGSGAIGIEADGSLKRDTNFLVRSRALFADQGFLVAVVDRPSDWAGADKATYRLSAAHVEDAAAIAKTLRKEANVPIWFVGTSRGTISVANIASRLGRGLIAGIVLTSSVTAPGKRSPQTVLDVDLSGIAVPTLIVGHGDDDCRVTPWSEQQEIAGKLKSSPSVESYRIDGGDAGNLSAPCQAISHHGFFGQEAEVVAKISKWIKAHGR